MAYVAATAEVRKVVDLGVAPTRSVAGAAGSVSIRPDAIFLYCSSHAAEDITGTGFFAACGGTPWFSTGAHPNIVARSTQNVGMYPGSLLVNVESSGGATPGRVTWHAVKGSTFNGSTNTWAASNGYDCTVSSHAST